MYGHDPAYADKLSHNSLAFSVCQEDENPLLMTGQAQAALYQNMAEYLKQDQGKWLCVLVLVIWMQTMMAEFMNVTRFAIAVASVPRDKSTKLSITKEEVAFDSFSPRRAVALGVFCVLPRLIIAAWLGYVGCFFLLKTTSIEDLFLNALALELVLNIDELLFKSITPVRLAHFIEKAQPIKLRTKNALLGAKVSLLKLVVACGCLAYLFQFHLIPQITLIKETQSAMCGGKNEFLFLQRATGVVFIGTPGDANRSSLLNYRINVVKSATEQYPSLSAYPYVRRDLSSYQDVDSLLRAGNQALESIAGATDICADFESDVWSRRVSPSRKPSVSQVLIGLAQSSNVHNCSSAAPFCSNPSTIGKFVRFHCPETCGCNDVGSGLLLSGSSWGCPSACKFGFTKSLEWFNYECFDKTTADMSFEKYLQNLGKQYTSNLNTTVNSFFCWRV